MLIPMNNELKIAPFWQGRRGKRAGSEKLHGCGALTKNYFCMLHLSCSFYRKKGKTRKIRGNYNKNKNIK